MTTDTPGLRYTEVIDLVARVEHFIQHYVMILDSVHPRDRDLWHDRQGQITGNPSTGDRVQITPVPYLTLAQTAHLQDVQQIDVSATSHRERTLNARSVDTLFQRMSDLPLDDTTIKEYLPLHKAILISHVWWTNRRHPTPTAWQPVLQPVMALRARIQAMEIDHEANGALAVLLLDLLDDIAWYTVMRHLYDIISVLGYDVETMSGTLADQQIKRLLRSYTLFLMALADEAATTYTTHDAPHPWEQPLYTTHFLNLWAIRSDVLHRLMIAECTPINDEQQTQEKYDRLQRLVQHTVHQSIRGTSQ